MRFSTLFFALAGALLCARAHASPPMCSQVYSLRLTLAVSAPLSSALTAAGLSNNEGRINSGEITCNASSLNTRGPICDVFEQPITAPDGSQTAIPHRVLGDAARSLVSILESAGVQPLVNPQGTLKVYEIDSAACFPENGATRCDLSLLDNTHCPL